MAKRRPWLFLLLLTPSAVSCVGGPDLVVTEHAVTWTSIQKSALTRVANQGDTAAGPFLVYVNGEEDPESSNHRPQVRHSIPGLAVGGSVDLVSDFAPLAHVDNHQLANVRSVHVFVDPKNMVVESDETNNEQTVVVRSCAAVVSGLDVAGHSYVGTLEIVWGPFWITQQNWRAGQSFIAPVDGRICGIELALGRYDALETDELTLRVFDGSTLLAESAKSGHDIPLTWATILPSLDPAEPGVGYFDLSSANAQLVAGRSYLFEVSRLGPRVFSVGSRGTDYPDGTKLAARDGAPLTPTNGDLTFRLTMR